MIHKNLLADDITVIGAGLAGSLLTVLLSERGFKVNLIEKRADVRSQVEGAEGSGEGRSINLALSVRGLHALSLANLEQPVRQQIIPMRGRMIHPLEGELTLVPYGKNEHEVINSVSRNVLNALLLERAEKSKNVHLTFEVRTTGYDLAGHRLHVHSGAGHNQTLQLSGPLIATDGAFSAVRSSLLISKRFNYQQNFLEHGYKELTIPPTSNGDFAIDPNALHIWPRGQFMMIALPNTDKSFTATLFFPHRGEPSFEALKTAEDIQTFFQSVFPDSLEVLPNLIDEFLTHPTGDLITVKCGPWNFGEKTLLLGDAAHAIVPFYGQGMNCAFEDCTILIELVESGLSDWGEVFEAFYTQRKEDADAIAELAIDNFIEMRDTSADPTFYLKRKLEHKLEEQYPEKFISKYSMVSFHRIPYRTAMKRGRLQDQILMQVCRDTTSLEQINIKEVFQRVQLELQARGLEH